MFYSVTIIVVMGVARPLWLRLPTPTGCSASSLGRSKSDSAYSSLEKKAMLTAEGSLNLGMGQYRTSKLFISWMKLNIYTVNIKISLPEPISLSLLLCCFYLGFKNNNIHLKILQNSVNFSGFSRIVSILLVRALIKTPTHGMSILPCDD